MTRATAADHAAESGNQPIFQFLGAGQHGFGPRRLCLLATAHESRHVRVERQRIARLSFQQAAFVLDKKSHSTENLLPAPGEDRLHEEPLGQHGKWIGRCQPICATVICCTARDRRSQTHQNPRPASSALAPCLHRRAVKLQCDIVSKCGLLHRDLAAGFLFRIRGNGVDWAELRIRGPSAPPGAPASSQAGHYSIVYAHCITLQPDRAGGIMYCRG